MGVIAAREVDGENFMVVALGELVYVVTVCGVVTVCRESGESNVP